MIACELIDEYIDGELSNEQHEQFRRHLARCEDCQTAIESNRAFQRLVETAKQEFDAMTTDIRRPAVRALQQRRRSRRRVVSTMVFAASIATLFALNQFHRFDDRPEVYPVQEKVSPERIAHDDALQTPSDPLAEQVTVTFSEDNPYLAVPLRSTNPNVTVLWLHPTRNPQVNTDSSDHLKNELQSLLARNL